MPRGEGEVTDPDAPVEVEHSHGVDFLPFLPAIFSTFSRIKPIKE